MTEQQLLARLAKTDVQRIVLTARLAVLNERFDADTRKLADARGVSFIRRETIRTEIAANG